METGKPALASAAAHMSSVAAQTERRMEVQAPLTALYIHTVPNLPSQPLAQPTLAAVDPTALHLTMPPLYSKETLPFLTLHIASGLQPGLSVTTTPPAAKPKSSGKHLCPHCGRDCMKPSVLEKHLRCHTGERPYPCTVCGVSFKTQSNLYKHKRTQAHARLSSESEHSTVGSLDSISCPTEAASSSMDERSEESAGVEGDIILPAAKKTPVVIQTSESNENILIKKTQELSKLTQPDASKLNAERPPPINRHVVLQRQEATLFSKQWETSVSNSKSQSHESTDSGFSESSELYPSPGSVLPDHSMDSLAETTTEHGEETASQQENQEDKTTAKEQENKSLEERISKLISQNSAVVEDKHLENVRPRKTVLSKQGSIDLPMPYTYKDSFHFDMRISKMSNSNRKPGLCTSVPTQQSTTAEHAPLIRSNSLPYSVSLLQSDQSSSSYPRDYATLFRRGSSGQITPTGFSLKSVNQQQSSTHRPLVRQAAVDCNHATDALFRNSSVEEACTSSLRCHGEAGDICGETSNRKCKRRKAQKFAYNKWYMYGGGTFKKLYEMERAGENSAGSKGMKAGPNPEVIQSLQKRLSGGHCETTVVSSPSLVRSATVHSLEVHSPRLQLMPSASFNSLSSHILASPTTPRMPLRRNLSLSVLPLSFLSLTPNLSLDTNKRSEASAISNELSCSTPQSHVNIPSDRKKQRTDDKLCSQEMETNLNSPAAHTCTIPRPQLSQINIGPNSANVSLFSPNTINANASLGTSAPAKTISTAVQSSFMPKYQLKLPNTSDSVSSLGSKPKHDDIVSTSNSTPTVLSVAISETSRATDQNTDAFKICSSVPTESMPSTSSHINVISPVIHHCPIADTKTTASLRNSHVGHFSTIIQSPSFGTVAPITAFTPIHRTQSSPAAFTGFTSTQQQPTPQKTPLTPQPNSDTNNPVVPCQVVPGPQTTPKVFHVQTADLQICFQIISDEQLALIEPQIEKQADSSHLQTVQEPALVNEVRTCTTLESTDKEISHKLGESNKEVGTLNQNRAKPSVCDTAENETPTIHTSQATSESLALSAHLQSSSLSSSSVEVVVSTAVSPKEAMSVKSQIPQEESMSKLVSKTFSDEDNPMPVNASLTSHCPRNNERMNCDEKENEEKKCSAVPNKSVTRSNLQLSMVSLSLSQTNPASEMERLSHEPISSPAADSKQTNPVVSVSTESVTPAASTNLPDTTGGDEGRSAVGGAKLQSNSEVQHSHQNTLGTCGEGFTSLQPGSMVS